MMTRQSSPWLPWKLCLPHQCCLDKSFDLLFGIARVCVSACVFVCLRFEWPGNVMQHHPENWGVSETVCVCVHACQMSHTHTSGSIICSLQFETSEQHVFVCVCIRWAGDVRQHYLHSGAEAVRRPSGYHHLRHRGAFWPHHYIRPHQERPGREVHAHSLTC